MQWQWIFVCPLMLRIVAVFIHLTSTVYAWYSDDIDGGLITVVWYSPSFEFILATLLPSEFVSYSDW
jgi:hypothetical protein